MPTSVAIVSSRAVSFVSSTVPAACMLMVTTAGGGDGGGGDGGSGGGVDGCGGDGGGKDGGSGGSGDGDGGEGGDGKNGGRVIGMDGGGGRGDGGMDGEAAATAVHANTSGAVAQEVTQAPQELGHSPAKVETPSGRRCCSRKYGGITEAHQPPPACTLSSPSGLNALVVSKKYTSSPYELSEKSYEPQVTVGRVTPECWRGIEGRQEGSGGMAGGGRKRR